MVARAEGSRPLRPHGRRRHGRSRREPRRSRRERARVLRLQQPSRTCRSSIRAPFSLTASRRVADPVRSVDVMPTVLDLLGVAVAEADLGREPRPADDGRHGASSALDAYSEAMYPLHHYGWSDLRALRSGRYKVIDAPRPELYDIDRDPGEADEPVRRAPRRRRRDDRAAAHARGGIHEDRGRAAGRRRGSGGARAAGRPRLRRLVRRRPHRIRGPAAPIRRTRSACSTSSAGAIDLAKDNDDEDAPPSPEMIGAARRGRRARTRRSSTPGSCSARSTCGTASRGKAVEYFKKTLSLKPDYDLAVINLAQAYRALGDDDAALAGFEQYLQLDPKDPFVHYQMGEIWLDRGDHGKAEQLFRQALETRPAGGGGEERARRHRAAARRPDDRGAADPRGDRRQARRAARALQPGAPRRTARRRRAARSASTSRS